MTDMTLTLALHVDPTVLTPEQAAEYAAAVLSRLTATALPGTAVHLVGIDKQLARLNDNEPTFAPRVKRLHQELMTLGYTPKLPKSDKGTPPPYISYIDPATGENIGNLNSRTFHVMRTSLRDSLKATGFSANSRYAYRTLNDEAAVDAVVAVAKDVKN